MLAAERWAIKEERILHRGFKYPVYAAEYTYLDSTRVKQN